MYGNAKAIETVYNGYKFRSRLEARWAMFFDSLGVAYEYEPEGFDLTEVAGGSKTVWYLPDFYLPELNCFAEVKGRKPTVEEMAKAKWLSEISEEAVVILWGKMECPTGYEVDDRNYFFNLQQVYKAAHFATCSTCNEVGIYADVFDYVCPDCGNKVQFDHWSIQEAYRKAKQSRFEFDFRASVIQ